MHAWQVNTGLCDASRARSVRCCQQKLTGSLHASCHADTLTARGLACARFMAEVGAAEQVPLSAGGLSDTVVAQRRADALARF